MRLLNILFGQGKPARSKLEGLFSISTAQITLEVQGELKPTRRAGICFRPVEAGTFVDAEREVLDVAVAGTKDSDTRVENHTDEYNFRWLVFEDEEFEDLVAAVYVSAQTLAEKGYRDQLLASVFGFEGPKGRVYLIYNYKLGKYYPFAPMPDGSQNRNYALELRVQSLMQKELPMEKDTTQWYPLWGIPV